MGSVCAGNNQKERVKDLWIQLKTWYKTSRATCKLQNITLEMIKKQKKSPKFKAKGAETRHLVPFVVEVAKKMYELKLALLAKSACRRTCMLFGQLASEAAAAKKKAWVFKPKFHMFVELVEYMAPDMGNPATFWEYKDEDFVGWIAKLATSRGGKNGFTTLATRVLQRYRALASM